MNDKAKDILTILGITAVVGVAIVGSDQACPDERIPLKVVGEKICLTQAQYHQTHGQLMQEVEDKIERGEEIKFWKLELYNKITDREIKSRGGIELKNFNKRDYVGRVNGKLRAFSR